MSDIKEKANKIKKLIDEQSFSAHSVSVDARLNRIYINHRTSEPDYIEYAHETGEWYITCRGYDFPLILALYEILHDNTEVVIKLKED